MNRSIPTIIALTADYVVVDKPRGLPVDMGEIDVPSLSIWVKDSLMNRGERIGKWGVHPVHFIDRSVGGLVLFSRKKTVFTFLQKQFQNRTIKKIYRAETTAKIPSMTSQLTLFHKRSNDGKRALIFSQKQEGTTVVDLRYSPLSGHWYEINLGSGKYHQIRAMLAHLGAPIVGDSLYNGSKTPPDKIQLYAVKLSFIDPKTNCWVDFNSTFMS